MINNKDIDVINIKRDGINFILSWKINFPNENSENIRHEIMRKITEDDNRSLEECNKNSFMFYEYIKSYSYIQDYHLASFNIDLKRKFMKELINKELKNMEYKILSIAYIPRNHTPYRLTITKDDNRIITLQITSEQASKLLGSETVIYDGENVII